MSSPNGGPALPITGVGFRGWRAFTIAAAAAVLASVAFVILTVFRVGGDQTTIAIDDIGEAIAAMIAGAASTWFAKRSSSARAMSAWMRCLRPRSSDA